MLWERGCIRWYLMRLTHTLFFWGCIFYMHEMLSWHDHYTFLTNSYCITNHWFQLREHEQEFVFMLLDNAEWVIIETIFPYLLAPKWLCMGASNNLICTSSENRASCHNVLPVYEYVPCYLFPKPYKH